MNPSAKMPQTASAAAKAKIAGAQEGRGCVDELARLGDLPVLARPLHAHDAI